MSAITPRKKDPFQEYQEQKEFERKQKLAQAEKEKQE